MLRSDLIDLINSTDMWAFVGSGPSIDSGYPGWSALVMSVVRQLDKDRRAKLLADQRYIKAAEANNWPRALSRVQRFAADRDWLEKVVAREFEDPKPPGQVIQRIADWPFAGYVTTNYDGLIQRALETTRELGWLPVGNTEEEVRKVSGDAERVVWHIHGGINLPAEKSKLVLTEEDYDKIYVKAPESPLAAQLRTLLAQRRIVFLGFGFKDVEVMRLIKAVGLMCSPTRPAFAFLSGLSGSGHMADRLELLERYNVDVIPYEVRNGSHEKLVELLDMYGALVLKRSLRFGHPQRFCPSYDPETTALLMHNRLALSRPAGVPKDISSMLMRSRILSLLKYRGRVTVASIRDELSGRARILSGDDHRGDSGSSLEEVGQLLIQCIRSIVDDGLAMTDPAHIEPDSALSLTAKGDKLVSEQAGVAQRLGEQFSASLCDRARQHVGDEESQKRVAVAVETFLKDCAERRALGVARAWKSPQEEHRQFHATALLQSLPAFMQEVASADEARALVAIIQGILAKPSAAEAHYLGLALQAHFAVNLLGYAPSIVEARARQMKDTLFLVDSTTLIPFLARSAVGHHSATELISRLRNVGSHVAATYLLGVEVAEHARWALSNAGVTATAASPALLNYATGKAGSRRNLFLDGFLEEIQQGKAAHDFGTFLADACGDPAVQSGSDRAFLDAIVAKGIPCPAFDEWEAFEPELWAARDDAQKQIEARRRANQTFKHERQVRAEAEALVIVQQIRKRALGLLGASPTDAYFVSHTGIIDAVAEAGLPITIRPESALQWVGTLTGCTPQELGCLVNCLLWELSQGGSDFVDYARIGNVFHPLIHAAKEGLEEELAHHRELMAREFGEDPAKAFAAVRDYDLPSAMNSYYLRKSEALEDRLRLEQRARDIAESKAALREKDVTELERFRRKQREKAERTRKRKRRVASEPRKRRPG